MNALSRMTLVPLFVLPAGAIAAPGAGEPLSTMPLPPPATAPAYGPPDENVTRNLRPDRPERPARQGRALGEREARQVMGDVAPTSSAPLVRPWSPVMPVSR